MSTRPETPAETPVGTSAGPAAPAVTRTVLGPTVDHQTRCVHYRTELDVVAIRFKCCGEFYPCHLCHEETADHDAAVWSPGEQGTHAILCGVCGGTMSIRDYLDADGCASCRAPFNPGCRLHKHLYFG